MDKFNQRTLTTVLAISFGVMVGTCNGPECDTLLL